MGNVSVGRENGAWDFDVKYDCEFVTNSTNCVLHLRYSSIATKYGVLVTFSSE